MLFTRQPAQKLAFYVCVYLYLTCSTPEKSTSAQGVSLEAKAHPFIIIFVLSRSNLHEYKTLQVHL